MQPPRPRPDGERDRFWQWVDDETPSTQIGSSLRRTVEHLQTFRDAAADLDVVHLHYDDLKADLEGQMRQMAARLGIDVDEHRWPRLVQAATFESMRSRAGTTVPGGGPEHWIDPAAFFSRGTSGQWRDLLPTRRRCVVPRPQWSCCPMPGCRTAGPILASARQRSRALKQRSPKRSSAPPRFATCYIFVQSSRSEQPDVLVVAELSGHLPTLLRGAVQALLPDHDVFITDWANARNVPLLFGQFGLDKSSIW